MLEEGLCEKIKIARRTMKDEYLTDGKEVKGGVKFTLWSPRSLCQSPYLTDLTSQQGNDRTCFTKWSCPQDESLSLFGTHGESGVWGNLETRSRSIRRLELAKTSSDTPSETMVSPSDGIRPKIWKAKPPTVS